ncbi:MAG: transposase [Desulfobacteraceae bacterium IS3]|nr:MAG: transposase [Desulfobacteraceae bacterium IS3]
MSQYQRLYKNGGCYFFTVVTYSREKFLTHPDNISRLRESFKHVMENRPFVTEAIVILPDHLHCIWKMPPDDSDFSTRWMLMKKYFSIGLKSRINNRREKQIWQRRFWEHLIRNEDDRLRHIDYIHYNPVKHGYVRHPADWEFSSFKRFISKDYYLKNWGNVQPESVRDMDFE